MQLFKDKRGDLYPIRLIKRVRPKGRLTDGKEIAAKVYLDDGDEYGVEVDDPEYRNLVKKMSRIIPANPGFKVLAFQPDPDGEHIVSEYDVIGWREDEYGEFDPVYADDSMVAFGGTDSAIEEPNGTVRLPYVAEYEDRAAWELAMRAQAEVEKVKSELETEEPE